MQIWEIVLAVLTSFGGIAALILASIKFSANYIAEKLQRKYELKLTKELEQYKTALDNKNYISKMRFDKEFTIYQSVSSDTIEAVFQSANIIIALNANYSLQRFDDEKRIVAEKYNIANKSLIKFAPFIDSKIYESYRYIFMLFRQLLNLCQCYISACNENRTEFSFYNQERTQHYTLTEAKARIIELQSQISNQSDVLLKELRDYLSSRDVLD